MNRSLATRLCALASAGSLVAAAWLFLSALATEHLRFGYCGPSSLDAAEPACRIGAMLLYASLLAAVAAVVSGGFAYRLVRRGRTSDQPGAGRRPRETA